jgi:hypothetical protein
MRSAPKPAKTKISLNNQEFSIDTRVWELFEVKATGQSKTAMMVLVGEYLKEGKTVERALADVLEVFKLV